MNFTKSTRSVLFAIFTLAIVTSFLTSCDEPNVPTRDKYVYRWTIQNGTTDFQYVFKFATDTTFTIEAFNAETGESKTDGPVTGQYVYMGGEDIYYFSMKAYYTNIKGQYITLYKGYFTGEDKEVFKIYRRLEFNTGNKRTDWIEFYKQK